MQEKDKYIDSNQCRKEKIHEGKKLKEWSIQTVKKTRDERHMEYVSPCSSLAEMAEISHKRRYKINSCPQFFIFLGNLISVCQPDLVGQSVKSPRLYLTD